MGIYIAVKNRLLYYLGVKRWSVRKLAAESGVSASTLKSILYGNSLNPGIVTIKILCDGLGVTIVEFFDCDEFKNLPQELK